MILIVTNERDLTSDYVVLELRRRKLPFHRLNSERFSDAKVSFDPRRGEDAWLIEFDGTVIDFAAVYAAYFRRPGTPSVPKGVKQGAARRYCEVEWGAALASALNSLGERWLNSPLAILAAENKPRQLSIACDLGFAVPDTLVTNDFRQVQCFLSEGAVVAKPLREALLEEDGKERVIFTSRLDELTGTDEASVAAAPVIYQREIRKRSDIRVTVIGDAVYAAEILSQEHDETKTDWRRGSRPDLSHRLHELPNNLHRKCIRLVQTLGLRFGAVDLVLDRNGNYWFLEVNPNGQWAWIENRIGLSLAQAIVDELERIATCSPR